MLAVSVLFLFGFGMSSAQTEQAPHSPRRPAPTFSPFCGELPDPFDTDPSRKNEETEKERAYYASVAAFSKAWCEPGKINADDKLRAVDSMVAAWKLLWDEDPPYNAEFHEQGACELLVLMGITHELPRQMRDDPEYVKTWIEDCKDSCFTIFGDPAAPEDQRGILLQLQLRNDLLNHLKEEPATEPVKKMLEDAVFRLVW
jgi:hypothetical protein